MAYVEIHEITSTLGKAIEYGISDKVIKVVKDDLEDSLTYAEKDKESNTKVYKTLTTTLNCTKENAVEAFNYIRKIHDGKSGRSKKTKDGKDIIAWHVIQSFDEKLDAGTANEIGKKLAEECFGNFQCIISTHTNTDNTHNHIIFNAWSIDTGKKYHGCVNTYKKIRETSDGLCDEYGLNVIEHTRKQKLVKWVDEKGVARYYEPTERKNKINKDKYANANDYRNTESYKALKEHEKINRRIIKADIDRLLPSVKSYDELLQKLMEIGYEIKSKKVNGDWRSHISFRAPLQEKFSRDYKIGEDYCREALTEKINANAEISTEKFVDEDISDPNILQKIISADILKMQKEREEIYSSAANTSSVQEAHFA